MRHATRAHALLSASGASRWLACPPSAKLEEAEGDKTSPYALEGTLAHEIAEIYLAGKAGADPRLEPLRDTQSYTLEMEDCARAYADYVAEKKAQDTVQIVERRVDFSQWVPGGFGTADCLLLDSDKIAVIDFKYGKGIRVDATDNPQLKLYALGALHEYGFADDFSTLELCIFQPRLDHVSEWSISKDELLTWANTVLAPRAKLAADGKGEMCAGPHCRFCSHAPVCRALSDYCLATVSDDFEDETGGLSVSTLEPKDYAMILSRAETVKNWLGLIEETARDKLLADPGSIAGWKVVEGRSIRRYGDIAACEKALLDAGLDSTEIHRPPELLGITDMTKLLGKTRFAEVLGDLIVKPQGKPTVVPETDKRPVYSVADQFTIEKENN